jgi:hypothetical protein
MARPTDKIRLAALTPDAVAAEVDDRILRYLGRLAIPLSPGIALHVRHVGQSDLALTAGALVTYAQRGLPVWDWSSHGEAEDACQSLVSGLYGCPAHPGVEGGVGPLDEALDGADLDGALDLVLVAAWARVTLAKDGALTARQLGALAGLEHRHVRELSRAGELPLTGTRPATCPAEDARRWLGARGVVGL